MRGGKFQNVKFQMKISGYFFEISGILSEISGCHEISGISEISENIHAIIIVEECPWIESRLCCVMQQDWNNKTHFIKSHGFTNDMNIINIQYS